MGIDPTVSQHEIGSVTQLSYGTGGYKTLVGAFSVITNLRMDLFEALLRTHCTALATRSEQSCQCPDIQTPFSVQYKS